MFYARSLVLVPLGKVFPKRLFGATTPRPALWDAQPPADAFRTLAWGNASCKAPKLAGYGSCHRLNDHKPRPRVWLV